MDVDDDDDLVVTLVYEDSKRKEEEKLWVNWVILRRVGNPLPKTVSSLVYNVRCAQLKLCVAG